MFDLNHGDSDEPPETRVAVFILVIVLVLSAVGVLIARIFLL